jgi:hypothetical protein
MTRLFALLVLLAASCSKKPAQDYKKCLKLRVGMTRAQLLEFMGPPDETQAFVEGKSMENMRGRSAYEWATPSSMPAPNRVTVEEKTGLVESIRCGDSTVTTAVYVEPPAPAVSTAPFVLPSDPPAALAAPKKKNGPRESTQGVGASGRPLTDQ